MREDIPSIQVNEDEVESLRRRLGSFDRRQVTLWREMAPAGRLRLAFRMHQFALNIVRTTERQRHPDLSPQEQGWRVIRRMHGDLALGREREVDVDE
ncbi:MAG: hypothetical protein PVH17_03865 [Anaerolineae bacterium]|jgi:hypothetical protein